MKHKLFIALLGAVMAFGLTSCATTKMTTSPVYSLADSQVTNGELVTVLETQQQLEAEISGKFSWSQKIKKIVGMPKMQYVVDGTWSTWQTRGVAAAKAAVLYKALEDSGCDIVLAPIYNVTLHKRKFNIKVKGIGAKIVDVEQKTDGNVIKHLHVEGDNN